MLHLSAAERQQKDYYRKSPHLAILILRPSMLDVLLLELTLIPKFIPQAVSSELTLVSYYKRKIEKLNGA